MNKQELKQHAELIVKELTRTELEERYLELYEKYSDMRANENELSPIVSNSNDGYQLIPMNEIEDEAREIAVRWHENATNWIGDKHKLASDIMNYAKKQVRKVYGG